MKIKNLIKDLVPPIILKFRRNVIKKDDSKKSFISTISNFSKTSETLSILGNGPSLNESINKYRKFIEKNDCIVVNYFPITEYFEALKPSICVFADPDFFAKQADLLPYIQEKNLETKQALIEKTTWKLTLIVPNIASSSRFIQEIPKQNKNIEILYYNNRVLKEYGTEEDKFKRYEENTIPPPAQTVLNTSLYFGIFANYKQIYLFGADTSWVEDMDIDQDTNELFIKEKHFYGEKRRKFYLDYKQDRAFNVYELLSAISKMIENYWELEKYAKWKKVDVYNASERSWIDAFERKKPHKKNSNI